MPYLNHAGTSHPKPPEVLRAVQHALLAEPSSWSSLYEEAFAVVSGEFPEGGQLRITSGCTSSLALAVGDLPWQEGDVLLTSSLEHHALDRQAQALELGRGVVRRALPYQSGEPVVLSRLEELLARGSVRAVALTAQSNLTGERPPLEEIARICRDAGVLLLIDAAQTFGTLAFEEAARSGDIVVAAGHKSALGPQGVGVLYARAGVEFSSPGAACEVGEQACSTFPGFCDAGSVNLPGLRGLAAGLTWSREQGRREIAHRTEELAADLRRCLRARDDVRVLGGREEESSLGPVVSFVPEKFSLSEVEAAYDRAGVKVRVGTHCAPQALRTLGAPDGCVRVSFGPFDTRADVEQAVAALEGMG